VTEAGGEVVQLDVSRKMLETSPGSERVQAVFEALPFRNGAFDAVVAGFALRDARDLFSAVGQVRRVLRDGGRFAFCDLGKPDSLVRALGIALYLRLAAPIIGAIVGGRRGLAFASLFDTYMLTLHNSQLVALLRLFFTDVSLEARQAGAAIVVGCIA
jgi:demethylmenaquinone methyltransferase/2-methoxy-6-polyprenyl-1,4-benzoquinol methylase